MLPVVKKPLLVDRSRDQRREEIEEGDRLRVEEEEAPNFRGAQASARVLLWLPESHPLAVLQKAGDLTAARKTTASVVGVAY